MRPIFLYNGQGTFVIKTVVDMAYLVTHKMIRLPKWQYEAKLYFKYEDDKGLLGDYFLTKDKIVKEDENFYFFKFPFKNKQVEGISI